MPEKRSAESIANDTSIGIGKRIHEMRFVNGMPLDKALDAVGQVSHYLPKEKIINAYQKHIEKTLSNGVKDPYEEAFLKSELPIKTSSKDDSQEEYPPCPKHNTDYKATEGGQYFDHKGFCMRCNYHGTTSKHIFNCYSDNEAAGIAIYHDLSAPYGHYDQKQKRHIMYHFANNLSQANVDGSPLGMKETEQQFHKALSDIKKCQPGYNPYKEVDWKTSKKTHSTSNEPTQAERNEAHSKGIYLNDYGYARDSGATHNEILDAHQKGINIYDYGYIRDYGATHYEALKKLIPNYNPYDDIDWHDNKEEYY